MYNIVILHLGDTVVPFLESDHGYTRITERHYRKLIPGFDEMTAQAQERHIQKWLKSDAEIVCEAESSLQLPNTRKKLHGRLPALEDFQRGAVNLLEITSLFQSKEANYLLLSDILCGHRASALRGAEPSFRAALSVSGTSQPLEACLRTLVDCAVTRDKWKQSGCKIRRAAILDYTQAAALSIHMIDHSRIKVTGKGIHGAGHIMGVEARAQEGDGGRDVGGGQVLEVAAHGEFALPLGQIEMFGAHFRRDVRKKVVKVAHTHDGEHFLHFVRRMGN